MNSRVNFVKNYSWKYQPSKLIKLALATVFSFHFDVGRNQEADLLDPLSSSLQNEKNMLTVELVNPFTWLKKVLFNAYHSFVERRKKR